MADISLSPATKDDLKAVFALHGRAENFDQIPQILVFDELEELLDDKQRVLATDSRLAKIDGEIVGYAHTYYLPSEVRLERCYVFGQVDPEHRGRGVGRALMAWGVERATEQLQSSGRDLPKYIRVDEYDFVESAHRLFARMGFTPVRYNEQLLRPLTDLPTPAELDGIRIVPWPVERDEEIRQVKNAAFADHWGSTPSTTEIWEHLTTGYGTRLDLSFVAVDPDDKIVGHCLNGRFEADDAVSGRKEGWLENLGTLQEYRGSGIASAMIAHSMVAFADIGLTHAVLDVDSANPTGAAMLYRRLGFEPMTRTITHEIEIPAFGPTDDGPATEPE